MSQEYPFNIECSDKFVMPCIALDALKGYDELIGVKLLNEGFGKLFIAEALQEIRFELNESGAKLASEAAILPAAMVTRPASWSSTSRLS